jgi:hypothetical protein
MFFDHGQVKPLLLVHQVHYKSLIANLDSLQLDNQYPENHSLD